MRSAGKGSLIFGFLLALLSSATFGLLPLFSIPAMSAGVGVNSLLVYRFSIATVLMGIIVKAKGRRLILPARDAGAVLLVSLAYAGTSKFLTSSYNYMPSGIATTIFYLFPILVALLMVVFFKERFSWNVAVAAVLAMAGVYLLQGTGPVGGIKPAGFLTVLLSMVCYACYIVFLNHSRVKDIDNFQTMFYIFLGALVVVFINHVIEDGTVALDAIPDWKTGIEILVLGSIPTLCADLVLVKATRMIGSTNTALLSCMEPITAYLVGVLVFKEAFYPIQIAGILIILASVFLVIMTRSKIKGER